MTAMPEQPMQAAATVEGLMSMVGAYVAVDRARKAAQGEGARAYWQREALSQFDAIREYAQRLASQSAPEVTDAMVEAYLKANDAYWHRTDQLPTAPDKWRTGTPREATRESLRAALSAAPVPQAAAAPAGDAGEVLREANECRISLVVALDGLISQIENTVYAFRGDAEAARQAEGAVAHARKISAPWRYNGQWRSPSAPPSPAAEGEPVADEREAFEAWAKECRTIDLKREEQWHAKEGWTGRSGPNYESPYTNHAWWAWQARAALSRPVGEGVAVSPEPRNPFKLNPPPIYDEHYARTQEDAASSTAASPEPVADEREAFEAAPTEKAAPVAWVDGAALRWLAADERGPDAYILTTLNASDPEGTRTPLFTSAGQQGAAPAGVPAEPAGLSECKKGMKVLTPDGRVVEVWGFGDAGCRCSDLKWYCASELRHVPAAAQPVGQPLPQPQGGEAATASVTQEQALAAVAHLMQAAGVDFSESADTLRRFVNSASPVHPQATEQPNPAKLTDEQIMDLAREHCADFRWPSSAIAIARAIERTLAGGNTDFPNHK